MQNYNPKKCILNYIENHIPSMRYNEGEDFNAWKKKSKEKLTELLGFDMMVKTSLDFSIEEEKDMGDFTQMRFTFQSEPGYFVPGYIWIPKDKKIRTPMICLQGHSRGMHISLGVVKFKGDEKSMNYFDRNFCKSALANGYVPVAIEQRYMGECGGNEDGPGCCGEGAEGTIHATPSLLINRCAVGERVWDVMRLIDALQENFPFLDFDNLGCMGNSGGGTTTFYSGCMDERIKTVMPSCSVCTYKDSIINLYHCACNYIPGIAKYFDMGDLAGLIAPRRLLVVSGKDDNIFPISGVRKTMDIAKKAFEASEKPDNIALVVGDGGHRFYADPAYKKLNEMLKNQ